MAGEFKAVRFFVMMGAAAFLVCAVTMFYTHRATYGDRGEGRRGSASGRKVADRCRLEYDGAKYFRQQGSGEQQSWNLAFENGYTDGFKKTHQRE
jgi:hypothetical protein